MKVLFFIPPWEVNENYFYYENSLKNHLIPQANFLSKNFNDINILLPPQYSHLQNMLSDKINIFILPITKITNINRNNNFKHDIYNELYQKPFGEIAKIIVKDFELVLPKKVDLIMSWESPIDFFKIIYPDVLIINQMPGIFSRSPYPKLTCFDPLGLYKSGTLFKYANNIQTGLDFSINELDFTKRFKEKIVSNFSAYQPISSIQIKKIKEMYKEIFLLPLQTSHYNFNSDTFYKNQLDFLNDVFNNCSKDVGILVTEYKKKILNENSVTSIGYNFINDGFKKTIKEEYKNFIFFKELDNTENVSQFLIQYVDKVISASSSIGFQSMIWNKKLSVFANTYMRPYDSENPSLRGIEWNDRCINTISFIINRLCPLSSKTLGSNFLLSLINELLSNKKKGKSGLDLILSFKAIDKNYEEDFFNELNYQEIKKKSEISNIVTDTFLNELKKTVISSNCKAITVDIFDTLITRPLLKPSDVWNFLNNKALQLTNGIAVNFASLRMASELIARENQKDKFSEININNIYDVLSEFYLVDKESLNLLKQAEEELEFDLAAQRPIGYEILNFAKTINKPVYLVSDMYLPETVIKRILSKVGYDGMYDKIYLSSSVKKRKKHGLYNHVVNKLQLSNNNILHIGDNLELDYKIPLSLKIQAIHNPSPIQNIKKNKLFNNYINDNSINTKTKSSIIGTIATNLFDKIDNQKFLTSYSGDDAHRLGYVVLGPFVLGYVKWILDESCKDKVSDLYFLSREGNLFKEVFDIIAEVSKGKKIPNSHSLLISRKVINLANCNSKAKILNIANHPFDDGVLFSELFESRFGIQLPKKISDLMKNKNINNENYHMYNNLECKKFFYEAAILSSDEIMSNSEIERKSYLKYLKTKGIEESLNPGVVDIGWYGNLQKGLSELTNKKITGYYYAIINNDLNFNNTVKSFSPEFCEINKFRHFLEFLIIDDQKSLNKFMLKDENLIPLFINEINHYERTRLINELHAGVKKFCSDYLKKFKFYFDEINISYNNSTFFLKNFILNPKKDDARLFSGQMIEDKIGGVKNLYIIKPNLKNNEDKSYWKQGEVALGFKKKNSKNRNIENFILRKFLSEKKYIKYLKNRDIFFLDSRSKMAKIWYKLS